MDKIKRRQFYRLIHVMVFHCIFGLVVGLTCAGVVLAFDFAGFRSLIFRADEANSDLILFLVGFAEIFGGLVASTSIMVLPFENEMNWGLAMKSIAFLFVILVGCVPVMAQNAPAPAASPRDVPDTDLSRKNGDLSDKLNSTNGVITPEGDIDPAMRKPAPAEGATPVIPPPGGPGGRQGVEPK
jgi:hypothetical protein